MVNMIVRLRLNINQRLKRKVKMPMTPFPAGLPTEAIMIIIDKLRGSPITNSDLTLAAWNLAGYALNQLVPPQELIGTSCDALKDYKDNSIGVEDAIATLESMLPKGDQQPEGKLPWAKILSIAVKILLGIILV